MSMLYLSSNTHNHFTAVGKTAGVLSQEPFRNWSSSFFLLISVTNRIKIPCTSFKSVSWNRASLNMHHTNLFFPLENHYLKIMMEGGGVFYKMAAY